MHFPWYKKSGTSFGCGRSKPSELFCGAGVGTLGVQSYPGNLRRDTFRSRPFSNLDFSLVKGTRLKEGVTLQFRSEFFNAFNLHAFSSPAAVLRLSGFGFSNSTVYAERQIQFRLRLLF